MAGDGGYGGNGSVYWSIHHRSAGGPEPLKNKRNLGSPDPEHWIDLGVPGKVPAKMGTEINGHDPTPAADIGDGTGNFKVTLLFSTKAKPSADLQTALLKLINDAGVQLQSLQNGAPSARLEIDIPAINRATPPTGYASDPWEVTVSW